MAEEATFSRWLELRDDVPVRFGDLPELIAGCLHSDPLAQSVAEHNLEAQLRALVVAGELMVRDPSTLGPHPFPVGEALRRAVLLPTVEMRPLLARFGIDLRLKESGAGPTHWTIANAAAAIAAHEGWHNGSRDALRESMHQAAMRGELRVLDPRTEIPVAPDMLAAVRDFYERAS